MQFGGRFQSQSVKIIFFSVLGVLFFIISNLLTTPYVAGDQEFYRAFYENLETARFSEVAFFQYVNTGSAEPLYGIVMWVGAVNGIDKDVYISIFNTLLCLCIVLFLIKNKASVPFCVLIFSNYYLLVILTSAERLKFSYIFLAIAAVYYSSLKGKLWLLIAPLFHFQSFILIISRSVGLLSVIRIKRKIKYSSLLVFSGLFVVISVLTLLIYKVFIAYLVGKVNAYSDFGGLLGLVNIAILAIISTFIFKKNNEIIICLFACALFAVIVGPERVNMIAVTLFIYFVSVHRKTNHPLTLTLMAYFSLKSIDYIFRIFSYGNGFQEGGLL